MGWIQVVEGNEKVSEVEELVQDGTRGTGCCWLVMHKADLRPTTTVNQDGERLSCLGALFTNSQKCALQ